MSTPDVNVSTYFEAVGTGRTTFDRRPPDL